MDFPSLVSLSVNDSGANRISNPGCYPTGFLALVRPLIAAGLLSEDALLTVPAVSGYSGGGKAMIAAFDGHECRLRLAMAPVLNTSIFPEFLRGPKKAPIFMPSVGAFYAGMLVHLPLMSASLQAITADELYAILPIAIHQRGWCEWGCWRLITSTYRRKLPPMRWPGMIIWKFLCSLYGPKPILAYGAA